MGGPGGKSPVEFKNQLEGIARVREHWDVTGGDEDFSKSQGKKEKSSIIWEKEVGVPGGDRPRSGKI